MRARMSAALAALSALVLTACGAGSTEPASPDAAAPGTLRPLTIAVMPIVEAAPVYVAKERGLFAEQGLDVTIQTANTSSAIIPGVASGQYDIGFSNVVTFLLAADKGLPLQAVAPASSPNPSGTDDMVAIVAQDPEIRTAADLQGRKIGVNALNNISAVSIRQSVRAAGGDPDSVTLVEMGFAEQGAAVLDGRIDAGLTVEPYLSTGIADGLHTVAYPYLDVAPKGTVALYTATSQFADGNAAAVDGFHTALGRAADLINADRKVAEQAIAGYSKIDPALLPTLRLCGYPAEFDPASVTRWGELMVADKMIPAVPDTDALLRPTA